MTVRAGFEVMPVMGAFHELVGPVYMKRHDAMLVAGIIVEARHCNLAGKLHGGMLATMIDSAFAYVARDTQDPPVRGVTTTFSIDFMGSAEIGQWIEAHIDVVRAGRRVVFLNCFVWCEGQRIARASATFQIVGPYEDNHLQGVRPA